MTLVLKTGREGDVIHCPYCSYAAMGRVEHEAPACCKLDTVGLCWCDYARQRIEARKRGAEQS